MIIDFSKIEETVMPEFKGGKNNTYGRTSFDGMNKVMLGRLDPGGSVGFHKHETSSEIIYVLKGVADFLYDDTTETVPAGCAQYCPKGHSHSMINNQDEMLEFLAIVPEQYI